MSRCVHLHDAGIQCVSEAMAGSDFCADHEPVDAGLERLGPSPFQKIVLRLVALLLLFILLIPFYRSVRTLYLGHFVEAGEGG